MKKIVNNNINNMKLWNLIKILHFVQWMKRSLLDLQNQLHQYLQHLLKKVKEFEWLELFITIVPILYIISMSIWHAFGVEGVQPWSAIYFLSNHLFFLYFVVIMYYVMPSLLIRRVMKFVIAPYFIFKILYRIALWTGIYIGSDDFWVYVWSIVCVVVLLIGSIVVWMQLKRIY